VIKAIRRQISAARDLSRLVPDRTTELSDEE
jgi:hypothetical protein